MTSDANDPAFTVKLQFFGIFRQYINQEYIVLNLNGASSVKEFKQLVFNHLQQNYQGFSDQQLVQISAIANNKEILPEAAVLTNSCCLSILPPVCGG